MSTGEREPGVARAQKLLHLEVGRHHAPHLLAGELVVVRGESRAEEQRDLMLLELHPKVRRAEALSSYPPPP